MVRDGMSKVDVCEGLQCILVKERLLSVTEEGQQQVIVKQWYCIANGIVKPTSGEGLSLLPKELSGGLNSLVAGTLWCHLLYSK